MAMVKPRKRLLKRLWPIKRTSDSEKSARKTLFAAREGR